MLTAIKDRSMDLHRAGWGLALVAALSLGGHAQAQGGTYQDQGGVVVIEFESSATTPNWTFETTHPGYTDTGYLRWTGPNLFSSPGSGVFGFDLNVQQAATWQLSLHNRHEDPDASMDNDVWVRMDGGPWKKVYSNQGAPTVATWNWHTRFDNSPNVHTDALFSLSAGDHRIEFSGRSNGFAMDRMHLHLQGHPDKNNLNLPQSQTGNGPEFYCQAKPSSQGCIPTITTSSPTTHPTSGAGGYRVVLNGADVGKVGIFFTSNQGRAAIPFRGGTLCMAPPLVRGPIRLSAGTAGACDGSFTLIINDGNPLPPAGGGFDPGPGQSTTIQAWMRDPQHPDGTGSALSDAVELHWQ